MAKSRRGRSEGSIFYLESKGLWVAQLSCGYDATGKRLRRTVYGKSKKEVQDELHRLEGDKLNGIGADPKKMTLAAYLDDWLENTARPAIRPNTLVCYKAIIANQLKPHLGGVLVSKLTAGHVQALYSTLEKAGKSPRMRQLTHAVLHKALRIAIKQGLVLRNVCDAVERPRVPTKAMKVLKPDEAVAFFAAASGDRLEALFVLAVTSGLRQGELFALQWPDLDLEARTVSVQHSLEEITGQLRLTEPKTTKGRRLVMLPQLAVDRLREHRVRMAAEDRLSGPVFCDSRGGWLRKSNFLRNSFKPLLKKAGLPDIRFHDLRHTHATLLLSQGVHPKVVQERLGHSQIGITLDTYSHVLPSLDGEAADKLSDLFRSKPKQDSNDKTKEAG